VFVRLEKHACLTSSEVVQISVHATSLHNVLEVEIRLTVAYEVNFFTDQFLHYFVAATGVGRTRARLPEHLLAAGPAKIGKLF
jgi:hypothetical protein